MLVSLVLRPSGLKTSHPDQINGTSPQDFRVNISDFACRNYGCFKPWQVSQGLKSRHSCLQGVFCALSFQLSSRLSQDRLKVRKSM